MKAVLNGHQQSNMVERYKIKARQDSVKIKLSQLVSTWGPKQEFKWAVASCLKLYNSKILSIINISDIEDEYLFCIQLETSTTTTDVMEEPSSFFRANRIPWENCFGVYTNWASSDAGI